MSRLKVSDSSGEAILMVLRLDLLAEMLDRLPAMAGIERSARGSGRSRSSYVTMDRIIEGIH